MRWIANTILWRPSRLAMLEALLANEIHVAHLVSNVVEQQSYIS